MLFLPLSAPSSIRRCVGVVNRAVERCKKSRWKLSPSSGRVYRYCTLYSGVGQCIQCADWTKTQLSTREPLKYENYDIDATLTRLTRLTGYLLPPSLRRINTKLQCTTILVNYSYSRIENGDYQWVFCYRTVAACIRLVDRNVAIVGNRVIKVEGLKERTKES